MSDRRDIIGHGGGKDGGGSQHTPVDAPDTLHSSSHARVLDALCEGPIKGPARPGLEWIFLNGTPVQNPDGSFNFKGVSAVWTDGSQDQDYIPGFADSSSTQSVNIEAKYGAPAHAPQLTNPDLNAAVAVVTIPQLESVDPSTADRGGASVDVSIDLQNNGGGYLEVAHAKITGKSEVAYQRSFLIALPAPGPWDVRLRRNTPDSTDPATLANKTILDTITSIIDKKLRYPNTSIAGVSIPSSVFQSVPSRGYDVYLMIVKVPSNYDPETRTYTGDWDGTFKPAWTDNPVWCWYDLATQSRYGAGDYVTEDMVDKWALYPIAKYCDELVPTGKKKRATVVVTPASCVIDVAHSRYLRSTGNWTTDNIVAGDQVLVAGFTIPANNGSVNVVAPNVTTGVLDVAMEAALGPRLNRFDSGSFIDDGFLVGDTVLLSNFNFAANNGPAEVTGVSAQYLDLNLGTRTAVEDIAPYSVTAVTVSPRSLTVKKTLFDEAALGGTSFTLEDPTEPRFTCNLYLQTQEDAYRVLGNMASIFRAMTYWGSGMLTAVQDAPKDPVALYTCADVKDGRFSYSGSSRRARHTVALVTWNDPDDHYKAKVEYVQDKEGILKSGIIPLRTAAFGCTSRGQAHRWGNWSLLTERIQTQTVTFVVGVEGALARPGDPILVQDQYRAGKRFGGKIRNASGTSILLDGDVTLEAATTYSLICILPNLTVETKSIVLPGTLPWTGHTLTLDSAFSADPLQSATWAITASTLQPSEWVVMKVTEDELHQFEIIAIEQNDSKYDAIELGLELEFPPTTAILASTMPQNLGLSEFLYKASSGIRVRLSMDWSIVTGAERYTVQVRKDNGNWMLQPDVHVAHAELLDISPGNYEIRVSAWVLGVQSPWAYDTLTVLGKTAPPANVTGLTLLQNTYTWTPTWNAVADLDLDHYEVRIAPGHGAAWTDGEVVALVARGIAGTASVVLDAKTVDGNYTILVKAVDTSGNSSTIAASIDVTVGTTAPTPLSLAATLTVPT